MKALLLPQGRYGSVHKTLGEGPTGESNMSVMILGAVWQQVLNVQIKKRKKDCRSE